MKRRHFLTSTPCAALGSLGIMNTLLSLRMVSNAVAAPNGPDDYKALVCVFLYGGNDSFNMLVPTTGTEYANYADVRSNLAIPAPGQPDGLLPINVANTPGRTFGLNPALPNLRDRFNDGDLAFLANVGTLVEPSTAQQVRDGMVDLPLGLFGHNTQQRTWQTSAADNLTAKTGWGGRLGDRVRGFNPSNAISMNISLAGTQIWQVGDETFSFAIGQGGADVLTGLGASNPLDASRVGAARSMVVQEQRNLLLDAFAREKRTAYDASEFFSDAFGNATVDTGIAGPLGAVARTIDARSMLGHQRQLFFVGLGGWDSHADLLGDHPALLGGLDAGLQSFWDEIVAKGIEDKVTVFTASDFGRTIRSNGQGTDHAWGGHSIVMGGAVDGGKIFGSYPDELELAIGSGLDVGTNGRYVPTTSVEEYFAELALWFGLPDAEVGEVFPNLSRFYSHTPGQRPIGLFV